MNQKKQAFATRAVHAGEIEDQFGSPHTPVYTTTTFAFDSTAELRDVIDGRKPGCFYTRYGSNPTILSLEAKLAGLEETQEALVFSAGMAAISATFLAHGHSGIVCIGDAYGGTMELLAGQLPRLHLRTQSIRLDELDRLAALLADGYGLVFFETPTNPTLEIIDIQRTAALAHRHGALVVVDNTFASPINQRPLALGADIVLYGATKSLGGHSDLTAGVLAGPHKLLQPVGQWRKNLGQMLAPEVAHLLARSLYTLAVRVERQNSSAAAIAQVLSEHPRVKRVFYPGLANAPGYSIAAAQMSGFGGMVTLEVDGTGDDAARIVERLELFALAPSLGGAESLATQPVTTSHRGMDAAERQRRGITDAMIRLSVGLEDSDDLISDLSTALNTD